ncbi:hypothetical protein PR048_021833 [Dryococelus australis]|uniref:Uncharacterized protein n=1 Tax=Dryococelus australis TaxID=614101 RepID=A0ABQ9GZD5_9NEOP|nr:hypothetical protein PR048_021833 [Dryococelus australis]
MLSALADGVKSSSSEHKCAAQQCGMRNVIVAVGGEDDKVVLRSVECYDTVSCSWRALACLPFAVSKHGLVASGKNTLYLAGGEFPDGSASRSMWRYDPVLDVWQEMAPMLVPRSELGLTLYIGAAVAEQLAHSPPIKMNRIQHLTRSHPDFRMWDWCLIMSLEFPSPFHSDAAQYSPQSTSSALKTLLLRVSQISSLTHLNISYVQFIVYSLKKDEKTCLNMSDAEYLKSCLAMLDGNVYAVGGWEGSFRLDTVERYNPETNSWHFIPQMRIAVTSPAVVSHDGMLYVTGGAVLEDGDGIELVQRYDPRISSWTELAPMLIPRSGSAACILDGFIYVIGGWHASTENTNKVERYNMQTNTWEFKAPMRERRYRPVQKKFQSNPEMAAPLLPCYVMASQPQDERYDKLIPTLERYATPALRRTADQQKLRINRCPPLWSSERCRARWPNRILSPTQSVKILLPLQSLRQGSNSIHSSRQLGKAASTPAPAAWLGLCPPEHIKQEDVAPEPTETVVSVDIPQTPAAPVQVTPAPSSIVQLALGKWIRVRYPTVEALPNECTIRLASGKFIRVRLPPKVAPKPHCKTLANSVPACWQTRLLWLNPVTPARSTIPTITLD